MEFGTGATATATLASTGKIRSGTINTAGTGYSLGDVLTVATGSGGTFTVTGISGGGATGPVSQITLLNGGSGYQNVIGASTTVAPSGGSGCKINTTIEFVVASIAVGVGGSGYLAASYSTTGGSPSSSASGVVTVSSGVVTAISVVSGGGYLTTPTIVIAGSPGSSADLLIALRANDTANQDARLGESLRNAIHTVKGTSESTAQINAILAGFGIVPQVIGES